MPLPPLFLGAYSSLADALAERIAKDRSDRGEVTLTQWLARPIEIIVPSRGVMSAIEESLVRLFRGPVAGIELRTPDSFARKLLEQAGELVRVAPDLVQQLAMEAAAIRRLDSELQSPGIGSLLRRSYRDLRDGGVTLAEAQPRLRRADLVVPALEVWKEYGAILSRSGTIDPADLLARAMMLLPQLEGSPQIIFGFYDATRMQERLFEALASSQRLDSVWVPVVPSEDTRFAQRFLETLRPRLGEEILVSRRAETSDFAIETMSNPRREAKEVCRRIRQLLEEGVDPRAIAIVVRSIDEVEATLYDRAAEEFGFAIERGRERPLAASRIGRAVLLLESLGDRRFPRAAMVELLRTGIRLTESKPGADWIDRISRKLHIGGGTSEHVAQATQHLTLTDSERDAVRNYIDAVHEAETLLAGWPRRQSAEAWSRAIDAMTARFVPLDSHDVEALSTFDSMSDSLRLVGDREIDRTTIVDLIRSLGVARERPDAQMAILFTDLMQLRGSSFDYLFAPRMQSERFPQRRSEDVILTAELRDGLGIRQIGDGLDEERLLFSILTDAARRVIHFSLSRADAAGKPDLASSLLKSFATRQYPDERGAIYRDFSRWIGRRLPEPAISQSLGEQAVEEIRRLPIQMNTQIHRALAIEGSAHEPRFDGDMFDAIDVVRTAITKKMDDGLSPTAFEILAVCPHRFLLNSVLGIGDIEDPDLEIDIEIRARGTQNHRVLERLFMDLAADLLQRSIDGDEPSRRELFQRLNAALDLTYDELDRETPPLLQNARGMQREVSRTQLTRFVENELKEMQSSGWRPWRTELAFGSSSHHEAEFQAVELEAHGHKFRIRGKVDRIDTKADDENAIRIVDYKSGTAYRYKNLEKKIKDGEHVQLPLYAMAVASILKIDPDSVTGEVKPFRVPSKAIQFQYGKIREAVAATLESGLRTLEGTRYAAVVSAECDYCQVVNWCRERHSNPFEDEDPFK